MPCTTVHSRLSRSFSAHHAHSFCRAAYLARGISEAGIPASPIELVGFVRQDEDPRVIIARHLDALGARFPEKGRLAVLAFRCTPQAMGRLRRVPRTLGALASEMARCGSTSLPLFGSSSSPGLDSRPMICGVSPPVSLSSLRSQSNRATAPNRARKISAPLSQRLRQARSESL